MKKIKIFLGSSITDLYEERLEIESFVQGLNNKYIDQDIYINIYACEETSGAMAIGGSQSVHDKFITDEADATFFMFFHKAGEFTLHELDLARNTFLTNKKRPNVFVFFKTIGTELVDTDEIKAAVDKIANEYGHYYKAFEKTDTIKLEILQFIVDELDNIDKLIIKDDEIYIGDEIVSAINISNIYSYQNNPSLKMLKNKILYMEEKLTKATQKEDREYWEREIDKAKSEYNSIEKTILNIMISLFKEARKSVKIDKTFFRAIQLMEEGKIKEALDMLPSAEHNKEEAYIISQKAMVDKESHREAAIRIINNAALSIRLLNIDFENPERIEKIRLQYEAVYGIVCEYEPTFLFSYIDFLYRQKNDEKAVKVGEKLKSICNNPDNDLSIEFIIEFYELLARIYSRNKEYRKSEGAYLECLDLLSKNDPNKRINSIIDICLSLARLVHFSGQRRKEENYYLDAIEYADKYGMMDLNCYKKTYKEIARFYKRNNNVVEAEKYYQVLIDFVDTHYEGTDRGINIKSDCLNEIIEMHMYKRDYSYAEKYCHILLEYITTQEICGNEIKDKKIGAYLKLSKCNEELEKFDESDKYYQLVVDGISRLGYEETKSCEIEQYYAEVIRYYVETDRFNKAEKILDEALTLLELYYGIKTERYYRTSIDLFNKMLMPKKIKFFSFDDKYVQKKKNEYRLNIIDVARKCYNINPEVYNLYFLAKVLSDGDYKLCFEKDTYEKLYSEAIEYWNECIKLLKTPDKAFKIISEKYLPGSSSADVSIEFISKDINLIWDNLRKPSISDCVNGLASVLLSKEEYEKAIELLDDNIDINPEEIAHMRYRVYNKLSEKYKNNDLDKSDYYQKCADDIMIKYKDKNRVLNDMYKLLQLFPK